MEENKQEGGVNRVRVAIATLDGDTIAHGHFAHSTHFMIVDIVSGSVKPVEYRENPLGYVPDTDMETHEEHSGEYPYLHRFHRYHHLHGIEKYRTLREEVLRDVGLIIAGGACRTSIDYFTSEGVKFIFVDPGEPIGDVIDFVSRLEFDKIPKIARLQRSSE
ncbi:MAG TPA: NifB/NifX family molybdenum-iron cluster-binding protein [Sulfolobales archaeon]|nr:NifB/NifX family molybdenum-iron cluster-binding protein [Sulfolobales archaeon]